MATAMHEVKQLVDHLPDDSGIEDVYYHLYVLEKIRKGQQEIKEGKHHSTEREESLLNNQH